MTAYTILIVEDETIAAHYLKKQLEHAGHSVIGIVKESVSALDYFSNTSQKIDLVLMDIKIKGAIDGIALAKKIQNRSNTTAILFTTAYADDDFLQRAKETNSIGYLVKPIQGNTLLSTIEIGMSHFHPNEVEHLYHLCDDTYFDEEEQILTSEAKTIPLSHQERLILKTMLKNNTHVTTTQELEVILEDIMPLGSGTLRTILWRLRKKLPECMTIENIYNLGYKVKYL